MVIAAFTVSASLALILLAFCAWKDFKTFGDLLGAAQLFMIVVGFSAAFRHDMIWLVLVDFGAVLVTGAWFAFRRQAWSALLCLTFFAQLGAHVWLYRFSSQDYYAQYVHVLAINSLSVLQLLTFSWPGARYVARGLGSVLLRRGDGRYSLGHGALP